MPKHSDYCTHISNHEDLDILGRGVFAVNLRLYRTSPTYKTIVDECCEYIKWGATTPKEGYKAPHGFSGANAGIPFNIIALADGTVLVNAHYTPVGDTRRESWSNCGSLTLRSPIRIKRWAKVHIVGHKWANNEIEKQASQIRGYYPTIQHEIDHNNGILITDRRAKT